MRDLHFLSESSDIPGAVPHAHRQKEKDGTTPRPRSLLMEGSGWTQDGTQSLKKKTTGIKTRIKGDGETLH